MPKIYSYHVQLDTLTEYANQQLWLANQYYNKLIDLKNQRRAEYRALRTRSFPDLAVLEARLVELNTQIDELETQKKRENAQARTKVKNNPLVEQLKALKEDRKSINASVKAEREVAKPMTCSREDDREKRRPLTREELEVLDPSVQRDFSIASLRIDEEDLVRCKGARAECGIYWATYLRIERAVQQACKTAKMDPRFKRFRGEGCLGGQIQGGLPIDKVYSGDTHFRVDPLPSHTWQTRRGYEHAFTVAHLRIGSEDRQPVWLDLPIKLDRPLPSTGSIKEAYLKVVSKGLKKVYELKLTIDSPEFECLQPNKREIIQQVNPVPPTSGVVAINFGWRSLPDGDVRVAYLVDTQGHQESVRLPRRVKEAFALVERLQGFCDEHFDTAKARLIQFLASTQERPEWLTEMTQTISHWRSHSRLAQATLRLRDEVIGRERSEELWQAYRQIHPTHGPLPSYEVISSFICEANEITKLAWYLEVWRKKDKHLIEYYSNLRDKCQNQRKDLFRVAAKSIASRYNVVVIDNTKFSQMSRRAPVGEEGGPSSEELKASKEASPGELRSTIVEKVGKNHIVVLPSQRKTITCNLCGGNHEWNTKGQYLQHCPTERRDVDQDWNNCMNLLSEYEGIHGEPSPVSSRSQIEPELEQTSYEVAQAV